MKILLAAGVLYPDVGGPAIHVMKIAERLTHEGYKPVVVAYGDDPDNKKLPFKVLRVSRRNPKILQWLLYLILILKESFTSKIIYAFDPTAAGMPAIVASLILRRIFFIRIGGDPIWEREAESGRRVMPIINYYEKGLYKIDKPILFKLIKFVITKAKVVVFYNHFWVDFYSKYYGLDISNALVVKNPVFRRGVANSDLSNDPTIIFAGRFVTYKNLPLVMRAFDNVRSKLNKGELLLIGKGPEKEKLLEIKNTLENGKHITFIESLPQNELFDKIKESAISVGPALSEFNPNFILESLSLGKPVILSKGHGLSVDLPDEFLFDPLNQEEFEARLVYLLDPINYKKAVETVANLDMSQSWDKVTDFHLDLIKKYTK